MKGKLKILTATTMLLMGGSALAATTWVAGQTKVNNGDVVEYGNSCYEAQHNPGTWETPSSSSTWFWTAVSCGGTVDPVDPTPVPSDIQEWDSGIVYNGGDQCTHDGHLWTAGWWTRGSEPGTTGEWGVWKDQGEAVEASKGTISIKLNKSEHFSSSALADVQIMKDGALVKEINDVAWGSTASEEVSFNGDSAEYTINVLAIKGATGSASPTSFTLKANGTQTVDVNYEAAQEGTVVIKSDIGVNATTSYILKNSAGDVVATGSFNTNNLTTVENVPAGKNYTLEVADFTKDGNTYSAKKISSFEVVAYADTELSIDFDKAAVPTENITLKVEGLPKDKSTVLTFTNGDGETRQYTVKSNSTLSTEIEQDKTTWTISASSITGYKVAVSPSSFTANSDSQEISVTVSEKEKFSHQLSIFWCGFGGDYCGQSVDDDVYDKATIVILAFANSKDDGSLDTGTFPTDLIDKWHSEGKKVLISIGGQNGHWDSLFSHPDTFVSSLTNIINDNNLDGADLDIEGYTTPPNDVTSTIHKLRASIGDDKLIVVSPENVTVYPSASIPVPSGETGGSVWNYFVPIINDAIDDIDYVQPQMYNNDYITYGASVNGDFFVENYLGWMNKYPDYEIPGFIGVPENKLMIGTLASTSAGIAKYYTGGEAVKDAVETLSNEYSIDVGGVMFWDSHWDELNDNIISKSAAEALDL
jgi:chitinase